MFDLLTDILYNIDQYEFERVFETISHIVLFPLNYRELH